MRKQQKFSVFLWSIAIFTIIFSIEGVATTPTSNHLIETGNQCVSVNGTATPDINISACTETTPQQPISSSENINCAIQQNQKLSVPAVDLQQLMKTAPDLTTKNIKIDPPPKIQKPKIEAVKVIPGNLPSDSKTIGKIYITVSHPDGLDKIKRVTLMCSPLGWGENSKIFLYDDGSTYGDSKKKDGIYTGEIFILNTVQPAPLTVPVMIEDLNGQITKSTFVINVVSNINGIY